MSFFNVLELLPDDPIFSLQVLFAQDANPNKVNLGIGAYKDDRGKPVVLQCVRQAEDILLAKQDNKEYQAIDGDREFIGLALRHIFGESPELDLSCIYAAQTVGATAALRLAAELLLRNVSAEVFLPMPSWSNHKLLFERAGLKVHALPYYNMETHQIDFADMCAAIAEMPPGSIIVMQAACHNPSGMDPTFAQWQELSALIKKQRLFPFFDFSYHGFGVDFDTDARAVRYFLAQGHEMAVAYSFSKNLSLYGERLGMLAFKVDHPKTIDPLASQIKQIIRSIYSTPPLQGGRIAKCVFSSPELMKVWRQELASMQQRIAHMRQALSTKLISSSSPIDFSFLARQMGFFSFCSLNKEQVMALRRKYGIYLLDNSRINIAGLTTQNIDYVSEAILDIVKI